jgi:hypothetical protein
MARLSRNRDPEEGDRAASLTGELVRLYFIMLYSDLHCFRA